MTWAHEFAIPFFALAKVTKRILGRWVVFPAFRALFWPYFRALGVFLIDNGKNKSEGWFLLGLEGKSR